MLSNQPELTKKLDIAIEAALYALLAFMPFVFGVVHAWSELIVLLAAASLLILQAARFIVDKSTRPVLSWALLPLAVFLLVPVFQLIPLPAGMVKTLSPNTYKTKTELLSKLPANSSSQNTKLKGSNQEALASGAGGQDDMQKLASKSGMAAGPNVSKEETDLNPLRASSSLRGEKDSISVPSVVSNNNLQSTIYNLQSKMSLTFYPHATTHGLRLVLSVAIIFLVTLQYFTTPQRIKRLLACIAIVGGIVAVLAILQNITRTDKIFWTISTGHRIAEAGPFVNHNNFGQFMNLSIGAALALVFIKFHELFSGRVRPLHAYPVKGKSNGLIDTHNPVNLISDIADYLASTEARWFWFTLAMIILSAASVFLSLTRGGMLTLLIAAAFTTLLLTTRGSIRGRGWIMALMALGAFICVLWIGFDAVYERLATLSEFEKAQGGRWQIVEDIATAWTKFPLFGTGLDTHLFVYPMFDRATIPSLAAHAENEYAQLAEEMGLMGLLSMVLFGILICFAYVKCIRRSQTPVCSAAYGLGFGLLAILLHSFSDFGQHLPANATLTVIFCALLIILSKMTVRSTVIPAQAGTQNSGSSEAANINSQSSIYTIGIENRKSKIENNQSTIYNIQYTIICSLLALSLLWLILSPQGAFSASSAEKDFTAAQKSADFLEELSWQGSAAQYADLLRVAQQTTELEPDNVEYRHWLNVWRWRSMSRFTDASGNLLLPPQAFEHIGRLVDEFCDAIRTCPTYGQSWTVAGQLLYFILEPQNVIPAQAGTQNVIPGLTRDPGSPEAVKTDSRVAPTSDQLVGGSNSIDNLSPRDLQPVPKGSTIDNTSSAAPNNNLQSKIDNIQSTGANMIRTGYQLAPCDATVCFVTGLLEVTELQRSSVIPNEREGSVKPVSQSDSTKNVIPGLTRDPAPREAANSNLQSTIDNLSPRDLQSEVGFPYFSRCLQLDGRFFNDIAAVYLGIDRPDLVVELAADNIDLLNTTAYMLSDSDPNSILVKTARQKVFDLLLAKSESPDVSADTLASLAAIYAKEGKTTEAIDLYRRALAADYGNIGWRLNLAQILGNTGQTEEAIKECRICLRLNPNYAPAIRLIEKMSAK